MWLRGFNTDIWRIGKDCVVSRVSWLPYKYRSLYGSTMLSNFFLSLVESEFAHDEAPGLDRHYSASVQ